jgi:hypothetical protein
VAGDQAVMRAKDMDTINENSCFMNINAIKAIHVSLFWLHLSLKGGYKDALHIICTLVALSGQKSNI